MLLLLRVLQGKGLHQQGVPPSHPPSPPQGDIGGAGKVGMRPPTVTSHPRHPPPAGRSPAPAGTPASADAGLASAPD